MLAVYDHENRRISFARFGRSRRYKHFFGGNAEAYGFNFENNSPLHLIYLFDTSDPRCAIPTRRSVFPLCYGFAFGGVDIAYRLHRRTIELVSPRNQKPDPDFPYANYPAVYEQRQIVLDRHSYDPKNPEQALSTSAVFGLTHVGAATLERIAAIVDEFGYWDEVELGELSREQHLQEHPPEFPLMQGVPDSACVYRDCRSFGRKGAMKIIAIHEEDGLEEGEASLWGNIGEPIQLIFQMCPRCGTVHVSNQCT